MQRTTPESNPLNAGHFILHYYHYFLPAFALKNFTGHQRKRRRTKKEAHMNSYVIEYQVPHSGAGIVKEQVTAASEQNARDLVRAKFFGQEVRIVGGRMTEFGRGRDERRDGKR